MFHTLRTYAEHEKLMRAALASGGIEQTIDLVCIILEQRDAEIKRLRALLDHPAVKPTGIDWRNEDKPNS